MQDPLQEKIDTLLTRFDQLNYGCNNPDWEKELLLKMQSAKKRPVRSKRTGYLLLLLLTVLLNSFLFLKSGVFAAEEEVSRDEVLHTVAEQLLIHSSNN